MNKEVEKKVVAFLTKRAKLGVKIICSPNKLACMLCTAIREARRLLKAVQSKK